MSRQQTTFDTDSYLDVKKTRVRRLHLIFFPPERKFPTCSNAAYVFKSDKKYHVRRILDELVQFPDFLSKCSRLRLQCQPTERPKKPKNKCFYDVWKWLEVGSTKLRTRNELS